MKLTHALLTLPLIAALETSTAHGQMERIVETDYRYTWRGNSPVKVQRRIKFDMLSLGYRDSVAKAEAEVLKTYPWTTLIVSENEFLYERNCHDFAWAPFMYRHMGISVSFSAPEGRLDNGLRGRRHDLAERETGKTARRARRA